LTPGASKVTIGIMFQDGDPPGSVAAVEQSGDRVIETVAIGSLLLGALRLLGLLRELEEGARRGVRTR
jgi:hypothetical protein